MRLGSEVAGSILHLATAVHIVELVGNVMVFALTAIELIPLLPDYGGSGDINSGPVNGIVAIPAVDDILTLAPD